MALLSANVRQIIARRTRHRCLKEHQDPTSLKSLEAIIPMDPSSTAAINATVRLSRTGKVLIESQAPIVASRGSEVK